MGAVSSSRHRADAVSGYSNNSEPLKNPLSPSYSCNPPDVHLAKKPRLSLSQKARGFFGSSNKSTEKSVSRLSKYPLTKPQLKREVHAPCRVSKFGSAPNSSRVDRNWQARAEGGVQDSAMGNSLRRNYEAARDNILKKVRSLNKEPETDEEEASDDSSVEIIENPEERNEDGSVISDHRLQDANGISVSSQKLDGKIVEDGIIPGSSSEVSLLTKVEDAGKVLKSLSLRPDRYVDSVPLHKKLLESASRYNPKLQRLQSDIHLEETRLDSHRSLRLEKKQREEEEVEAVDSAHFREPFLPLEEGDEEAVAKAFSNVNRRKVLVAHESSNIEITGEALQCLRRGAWLNDEVINLYLELLKERERREPKKFLKCHFFNTFFYKKLIAGRGGYDYKAVRRWTTQRKLGYGLIECEKIFVPIHREVHWCLAVINKQDQKFEYLDSLGGTDSKVLRVLAKYYVDEVKDKSGQDIDVSSWECEFMTELPEQKNGYDCGMFMLKYADFFSRGMGLSFSQDDMPYFRLRTAKEILQLRAD